MSKYCVIVLGALCCAFSGHEKAHAADFSGTGSMSVARYCQTSTRLADGRILITGGFNSVPVYTSYASAELYDPSQGLFFPTGSMFIGRDGHTATLLPDGNVLIAGGYHADSSTFLDNAELYDPVSGFFSHTDSMVMSAKRRFHTATLLSNGMVLLAGGSSATFGAMLNTVDEIYDPVTKSFSLVTASMAVRRRWHTATSLPNGKALITGGWHDWAATNIHDLFNPDSNSFESSPNHMNAGRYYHTATLLPSGKVLITGGTDGDNYLDSSELYDPDSDTFSYTSGNMTMPRAQHVATLLSDGKVLITGGRSSSDILSAAELYDPASDRFSPTTDNMTIVRYQQTASMLADGMVLITGGGSTGGYTSDAELFDPSTYQGVLVKLESNPGATYRTLQGAYSAAADNDELMARNIIFSDSDFTLDRDISVTLRGGYEDNFTRTNGYTSIAGTVRIRSGSLKPQDIIIK